MSTKSLIFVETSKKI